MGKIAIFDRNSIFIHDDDDSQYIVPDNGYFTYEKE